MTRDVKFAVTQFASGADRAANVARAEALVREAAAKGANAVLLQELFETPYFRCQDQAGGSFRRSPRRSRSNPLLARMAALAKELGVVLPISFFERAGQAHFNSLAMIDADGAVLGLYRKSHIPDGPGYQEKYYWHPRRYRLQGLEDEVRHLRRGHLLGPVVSGSGADDGAAGGRGAVLSHRHRQRAAARSAHRQPRSLAAGDAGPCRRQPDAGDRRQPHRHGKGRCRRDHVSMVRPLSQTRAAALLPSLAAAGRALPRRGSIWMNWRVCAPPGACSATGARNCTAFLASMGETWKVRSVFFALAGLVPVAPVQAQDAAKNHARGFRCSR